jgi:glycosyltransferase involved in cell wall biosynthesis
MIKYISYGDTTGYGLSGLAYLRGLLNLGLDVHWQPVFWGANGLQRWTPGMPPQLLEAVRAAADDPALRDLPALLGHTVAPRDYRIVVAHLVPEYLPACLEPGKANFAYCTWESDRIPAHWPAILNRFDGVLVPSTFNAEVFRAGGVSVPLHVVPHIRRHAHDDVTPDQRDALRRRLGIAPGHHVFYTIGAWMLRKDLPRLIEAFVEEFRDDEPVALCIKTSTKPVHFPLPHEAGKTSVQLVDEALGALRERSGRTRLPTVAVLAADGVSGAWIDRLHQVGDTYVSLARAEGWGMGAFDAAALGRPVLMTGWSGQLDFLGRDHPGLIGGTLAPIDWPGTSYGPDHRWAVADLADARSKMRYRFERRGEPDPHARQLGERIANLYAEGPVMRRFRHAIGA